MGGLVSRGACLAVGLMAGGLAGPAMAQEAVDWTGFYAGVFAGYGLDTAIATSTTMAPVTVENNPGEFLTIGNSDYNERFQALFGGLQVGYNYQFDNFVFGIEGALALGGFNKARGSNLVLNQVDGADFTNLAADERTEFSIDWLTTFAGRAGMDFDGWLVYGKAGVAVADLSAVSSATFSLDSNDPAPFLPNGTYTSGSTTDALRVGAVIGIGVEKKLTEAVSLGLEYNYVDLGSLDVTAPAGLGGILGGGGDTERFTASMHSVRAALNYHF